MFVQMVPSATTPYRRCTGAGRMPESMTEELDYIRTAAIGDMLGDSRAFDELGPSIVVFRLCGELERWNTKLATSTLKTVNTQEK